MTCHLIFPLSPLNDTHLNSLSVSSDPLEIGPQFTMKNHCFVVAGSAIIQKPLNVATSAGGQTVLNCSSDTGAITWLYTANCNTAGGIILTDNNCDVVSNYASHYRTEHPDGFVCNLIVFDALLSLGGCYVCADGYGTGRQYQAMLVIIGRLPFHLDILILNMLRYERDLSSSKSNHIVSENDFSQRLC